MIEVDDYHHEKCGRIPPCPFYGTACRLFEDSIYYRDRVKACLESEVIQLKNGQYVNKIEHDRDLEA